MSWRCWSRQGRGGGKTRRERARRERARRERARRERARRGEYRYRAIIKGLRIRSNGRWDIKKVIETTVALTHDGLEYLINVLYFVVEHKYSSDRQRPSHVLFG